ncbi:polymorphic toxin type 44 domain-containing protein [Butyrivibrio sp. INlla21]|uniref:polymorphic toxin type 44 domain-containing protein n=1 Tax=Butyrivibrio sp. INlla21 TaxID=1520811 RepID=UPI0008E28BA5|nr:polymorphic toxin type 44 domain-containing protein [Butyrivibrio sp. INlla21]SFU33939.1 toxin 44 [Butyrivibrio sp. INlla21]
MTYWNQNVTVFGIPQPSIPTPPMPKIPYPSVANPNAFVKPVGNTYCGCENGSLSISREDYYAGAFLNLPESEIYNIDKLKERLKLAREHYKAEREKNKDGELLAELQLHNTPDANLPDYTEEIDKWLKEQEKYFDDIKKSNESRFLYPAACSIDFTSKFIEKVQTGGDMDIKQKGVWKNEFPEVPYPEGDNKYFLYHGQVMDPGTLGNVTYSYIGAKYYPEFALYAGGAAVQVKRYDKMDLPFMPTLPYMGDMSEDHEAIELGIEWRKEGFPSEEQVENRLKSEEKLRKIGENSDINRG